MKSETAIRFTDIGHGYRRGEWVLRGINGLVRHGEVFAILGPNGRGKTTLINILLGVLAPREGQVITHGATGFVPQLFVPPFPYQVLDTVLMGRARHVGFLRTPGRHDRDVAHAALEELDLTHLAERPITELSGGQRQMVMLARALASEADILILDEPASALDLHNQSVILDLIGRLADERELTILFTTHQPQHALAVADSAMLLTDSALPVTGPVDQVMTEEMLAQLYGIPLRRVRVEHQGRTEDSFVPLFGARVRRRAREIHELPTAPADKPPIHP
ncbi:MAG: ABC transporter ATP-binding protein [Methylohalobius sp. ZOD2]